MAQAPHNSCMARLVARLARLPGIGNRSAQRIAFHLLKAPPEEAHELAAAMVELKRHVRHCRVCHNLTEGEQCAICADARRDRGVVLVVEQPDDVETFEATGLYRGVYHVLMGRLAPLEGIGPGELNIEQLLERLRASRAGGGAEGPTGAEADAATTPVREVILGTNPTLEGDGTALYLAGQLAELGVKVSRLARGLPTGSSLELVSKAVLADALQGRQMM